MVSNAIDANPVTRSFMTWYSRLGHMSKQLLMVILGRKLPLGLKSFDLGL